MTRIHPQCLEVEPELIAAATGEANPPAAARVDAHVRLCPPCADRWTRYRELAGVVNAWRDVPAPGLRAARAHLDARLADLRSRVVSYRIVPSPLGNILIALSEQGVAALEYLGEARSFAASRLARAGGVEAVEDGAEVDVLGRELVDYLEGRRRRLDWRLDLRWARSDFQRAVLRTAAAIPYGAVASYAGLASEMGKPRATRAVAQALRHNPLPIVVPCHRVVGMSGALTGYAGDKLGLKRRLLATEGIQVVTRARDLRVDHGAMYVTYPSDAAAYCLPTCDWLRTLRDPQRLRFFGSRAWAEAAGLAPCSDCRPDLHPLSA